MSMVSEVCVTLPMSAASEVGEVVFDELAEALILSCWTKNWTREFLFETWLFELQYFTIDSLTLVQCKHDTYSPNTLAHTLLLDTYTH